MPSEETLWEGSPALKMLALDAAVTVVYAVALSLVVTPRDTDRRCTFCAACRARPPKR